MPRLFIDIEGRFAQFEQTLAKVQSSTERTAKAIETSFSGAASVLARFASVAAVGFAFKGLIDASANLNVLAKNLDMATKELEGFKYAAGQLDVPFESLTNGMTRMQASIAAAGAGDKKLIDLFNRLGMPDAAKGVALTKDAMLQFADAMKRMTTQQQTFASRELMGKEAGKLRPLLEGGRQALQNYLDEADKLTPSSDRFNKAAGELGNNLTRVRNQIEAAAKGLGGPIVEGMNKITTAFSRGFAVDGFVGGLTEAAKAMRELIATSNEAVRVVLVLSAAWAGLKISASIVAGVAAVKQHTGAMLENVGAVGRAVTAQREANVAGLERARIVASYAAADVKAAQAAVNSASGMQRLGIVQQQLVPAQQALTTATTALTAAQATHAAGIARSVTAMGVARLALTAMGGWVGLIITGLSIAAGWWLTFGQNAKKGASDAEQAAGKALEATQRAIKEIQNQSTVKAAGNIYAPQLEQNLKEIQEAGAKIDAALREANAKIAALPQAVIGGEGAATVDPRMARQGERLRQRRIDEINAETAATVKALEDQRAKLSTASEQLRALMAKGAGATETPKGINLAGLGEGPGKDYRTGERIREREAAQEAEAEILRESYRQIERAMEVGEIGFEVARDSQLEALERYRVNVQRILAEMTQINAERPILGDSKEQAAARAEQQKQTEEIAKRAREAMRGFGEGGEKAFDQATRAAKEFLRAVEETTVELLELKGQTREAVMLRFDLRTADFKRQLETELKSAVSPEARAAAERGLANLGQAREITVANADVARLQERAGFIRDQLQRDEEAVARQQAAGLSEQQALAQVGVLRQEAVNQLEAIAEAWNKIAESSTDPRIINGAKAFANELANLRQSADALGNKMRDVFSGGLSNALQQLQAGQINSLRQFLKVFADDVTREINRMAADTIAKQLFSKDGLLGSVPEFFKDLFSGKDAAGLFKGLFSGAGKDAAGAVAGTAAKEGVGALAEAAGAGLKGMGLEVALASKVLTTALGELTAAATVAAVALKATAGGAGEDMAGDFLEDIIGDAVEGAAVAHGGGIVGALASRRVVDMRVFRNAQRFHRGGLVAGEVPVIAQRGEGIFTAAQMKRMAPAARGVAVTNNFYLATPADPRTQTQVATAAGMAVSRAVRRNG